MNRFLSLVVLLAAVPNALLFAQSCQTSSSVPTGQTKLGGGTATAHYEGTTIIKGGQAVYVRIKNENALGVSYEITIADQSTPPAAKCTYKALLLPKTSAILWNSLFKEPPVGWKVTVAVGSESDAGVLTYDVFSKPR